MIRKLLSVLLVLCLLPVCGFAEANSEYIAELQMLNEYLRAVGDNAPKSIDEIYDQIEGNGRIGEYAVEFGIYANVLRLLEAEDYSAALKDAGDLRNSVSFEKFRAYLEDGEELRAWGLYALDSVECLYSYVQGRAAEARGEWKKAAQHYSACEQFMGARDRKKFANPMPPMPTHIDEPIIVAYGDACSFQTQIKADGSARRVVDADAYETLNLTLQVKAYKNPAYFEANYADSYILQGDEAAVEFDLTLNGYTGTTQIIPQDFLWISFRGEDDAVATQGFQLTDFEISGKTDVALYSDMPITLYKRYNHCSERGDMQYMVVNSYVDGVEYTHWFEIPISEGVASTNASACAPKLTSEGLYRLFPEIKIDTSPDDGEGILRSQYGFDEMKYLVMNGGIEYDIGVGEYLGIPLLGGVIVRRMDSYNDVYSWEAVYFEDEVAGFKAMLEVLNQTIGTPDFGTIELYESGYFDFLEGEGRHELRHLTADELCSGSVSSILASSVLSYADRVDICIYWDNLELSYFLESGIGKSDLTALNHVPSDDENDVVEERY